MVRRHAHSGNATSQRLADGGAAKMAEAQAAAPKRLTDQSANAAYTNIEARLHKDEPIALRSRPP